MNHPFARFGNLIQALAAWSLIIHSAFGGASAEQHGTVYQGPGTKKMAQRLDLIAKNANPIVNLFLSRALARA